MNSTCAKNAGSAVAPRPLTSTASKRWRILTGALIPAFPRKQIYDLAAGHFIRQATDVLFIGPPGVGQTHLAQALGYAAIRRNFQVLDRSIFDLGRDFLKDEAFHQQDRVLRRYLKPDLLIIDDRGLQARPKHSVEYLLEVVRHCYENRSPSMTSNRPLQDWGKLLGDVPAASAILDRFRHHAQTITIAGRSYRRNDQPPAKAEKAPHQTTGEPAPDGTISQPGGRAN